MNAKQNTRSDAAWMTNKNKVLFPDSGITKAELANYYGSIAPLMIPYMKGHPVAMQRFPDGIEKEGFYQKDIPSYFPAWISRVAIDNRDGTQTTYVLCQNGRTLVYLAYQACITPHLLLSRADKLDYPDRMIFDLDPGEKTTFSIVQRTAVQAKELLDALGLVSYAMTTGSRGIHVVIPLKRLYPFEQVHAYAFTIARHLAAQNPTQLTIDIRKKQRQGRLFVDFLRNTYAHHAVAPYGVRPLAGAPVATPLSWDEVMDKRLSPQKYTIRNIQERIEQVGNVWTDFFAVKNVLKSSLT